MQALLTAFPSQRFFTAKIHTSPDIFIAMEKAASKVSYALSKLMHSMVKKGETYHIHRCVEY